MLPILKKYRSRAATMLIAASQPETTAEKAANARSQHPILAMVLIGVSALATLAWIAMGIWLLVKLF
jgi:hypothetical protein